MDKEPQQLKEELAIATALYENSSRALQIAEDKILDLENELRQLKEKENARS